VVVAPVSVSSWTMEAHINRDAIPLVQPPGEVHRDGEASTCREFVRQRELHLPSNLRVLATLRAFCGVPQVGPTSAPSHECRACEPPSLAAIVVRFSSALADEPSPGSIGSARNCVPAIGPTDSFERQAEDGHGTQLLEGGEGGAPPATRNPLGIAKACPSGSAPPCRRCGGQAHNAASPTTDGNGAPPRRMASAQPQSSTSPWVLAHRVEQAARGEACARALRDADLIAVGAPPGGIALVGGTAQAARTNGAAEVALWLAAITEAAGLLEPARALYFAQRRGNRRVGAHTLHAPELAARELARQALDYATCQHQL
jgi:hypothetical protein